MKNNDDRTTKKYDESVLNQVLKIRKKQSEPENVKPELEETGAEEVKPEVEEAGSGEVKPEVEEIKPVEVEAGSEKVKAEVAEKDKPEEVKSEEVKSEEAKSEEVKSEEVKAGDVETGSEKLKADAKKPDAGQGEKKSKDVQCGEKHEEKAEVAAEVKAEAEGSSDKVKAEDDEKKESKGVSRAYGKKGPRKRKKHRKKHYLLKFSIALAIVVGALVFLNNSMFDINEIAVEGNSRYSADEIIIISGLSLNSNIFWAKLHKGEKALLANPYFEEADISREMPDKVNIRVKERVPFVAIRKKEKWVLLDKNDVALDEKKDVKTVTRLYGMFIKEYELGEKAEISGNEPYEDVKVLLNNSSKQKIHYKRVDVYKNYVLVYISDKLFCKGTLDNLIEAVDSGNMRTVVIYCRKAGLKKGVVNIAGNGYVSIKAK